MTFSTSDPAHYRAMMKRGQKACRVSVIDGEEVAWVFELPADWFKLPRPKKAVGDAQRERMRQVAQNRWEDDEEE